MSHASTQMFLNVTVYQWLYFVQNRIEKSDSNLLRGFSIMEQYVERKPLQVKTHFVSSKITLYAIHSENKYKNPLNPGANVDSI